MMECNISAISLGHTIYIMLDFGDDDVRNFTMNDQSLIIKKIYKSTGKYVIRATAQNTSMSIINNINGKILKIKIKI